MDLSQKGQLRFNIVDGFAFSSGTKFGFVSGSNTWTLVPKVDGDLVTHFSTIFPVWGGGAELTTVTATFTDDSTETFTSETAYQGTTTYQFVGFQAPAGLGISSITSSNLFPRQSNGDGGFLREAAVF